MSLRLSTVDVFGARALSGNPVAVVHDADALSYEQMQEFANWTNLSETTFLLQPTQAGADYRVRIFTPSAELPFAGHPTLGSAHAWLEAGGEPAATEKVVQECGLGLVELRRTERLAFAAPGFVRGGAPTADERAQAIAGLGVTEDQVHDVAWIDNGPGWIGVQVVDAQTVLDIVPDVAAMGELKVGVLGRHLDDGPADVEVRAFCPSLSVDEDPVTGSLNAGFAVWLTQSRGLPPAYIARQGTALGRDGRVHIETDAAGTIWVGGDTATVVAGDLNL